jgi:hypothetical protein
MTTAETLMQNVLARLLATTPAPLLTNLSMIRRFHRTAVTRELAPAVQLIDGAESKTNNPMNNKGCDTERELTFKVLLFLREEDGITAADPLKIEVYRRLDQATTPYPNGARIYSGRIVSDSELGDNDAARVEMEFSFKYVTKGWGLEP